MKVGSWKKVALLGTLMGTCFTAGVYAEDVIQRVDAYLRSDFNVVVNGEQVKLANPPLIYNDSSYLPVKELGNYLGAVVNWQGSTKTIFINSRIYAEQPAEGSNETYDSITLVNPQAYMMQYLGNSYPVLLNQSTATYYRLRDVQRMGIDVNGLRKAKEKYTEELYVSEAELSTRWKAKPSIDYTAYDSIVVTGETDPNKLKTFKEYVNGFRSYSVNGVYHYTMPIIIDALPETDEYAYLSREDGHFYMTMLKLTETSENNFVVGSYSRQDIETKAP